MCGVPEATNVLDFVASISKDHLRLSCVHFCREAGDVRINAIKVIKRAFITGYDTKLVAVSPRELTNS